MATIAYKDINDGLRLISLSDRMDVPGTEKIEAELTGLAKVGKRNVVVDLAGVTFLSSVGIRLLIASGKALKQEGGRMALVVGVNAGAIKTLKTTCVDAILPMFEKLEEAEAALQN